jgi:hypothetical protein
MAHERLERPGIDAATSQGITRAMAQHVGMDAELEACGLAKPFYKLLSAVNRQRCLALAQEQELGRAILPDQGADQPQLVACQTVNARGAVLRPTDVQGGRFQVELVDLWATSSDTLRACL